jgi:hypothetical protein
MTQQWWSVAEHVGSYGHRDGDIPATHRFRVFPPDRIPEETDVYATVALFDTREAAMADMFARNAKVKP